VPQGFDGLPLRFGAHNLHENQPGAYRSERLVFATYFSAGVRVYDLADPARPAEVAHWIPEPPAGQAVPQINDLYVDSDGLLWATDRIGGGLYVLRPGAALERLMDEARA
jgi:sugar lactone lactonase YvrE